MRYFGAFESCAFFSLQIESCALFLYKWKTSVTQIVRYTPTPTHTRTRTHTHTLTRTHTHRTALTPLPLSLEGMVPQLRASL